MSRPDTVDSVITVLLTYCVIVFQGSTGTGFRIQDIILQNRWDHFQVQC